MWEGPKPLRLPESRLASGPVRRAWLASLYAQRWHLYAKRPFGGPEQVLAYLANYTHRVALSNRRLVALDRAGQSVTFTYRDYRHGAKVQKLTLSAVEFIRRFCWHILPSGLVRIRHYGILANNRRQRDVARARTILARSNSRKPKPSLPNLPAPLPTRRCPHCGSQVLRWIGFLDAHGRTHLSPAGSIWDSS
jgi:hypothetical protein